MKIIVQSNVIISLKKDNLIYLKTSFLTNIDTKIQKKTKKQKFHQTFTIKKRLYFNKKKHTIINLKISSKIKECKHFRLK